jgi:hypothetical protein
MAKSKLKIPLPFIPSHPFDFAPFGFAQGEQDKQGRGVFSRSVLFVIKFVKGRKLEGGVDGILYGDDREAGLLP